MGLRQRRGRAAACRVLLRQDGVGQAGALGRARRARRAERAHRARAGGRRPHRLPIPGRRRRLGELRRRESLGALQAGERTRGSGVRHRLALPGREQLLPRAGERARGQRQLLLRRERPAARGEGLARHGGVWRLAPAPGRHARRPRRGVLRRHEGHRRARRAVLDARQGRRLDEGRLTDALRRPDRVAPRVLMADTAPSGVASAGAGEAPAAAALAELQPASLGAFLRYFLYLGSMGFGGPIALAGYMQRDLVEERRWIADRDYREGLALAQLAPGPLAAQLAIYLGWVRARVLGATLVGVAFILPSFLMVLALAALYVRYGGLPWMQGAFYGVGAAVIARSALKL